MSADPVLDLPLLTPEPAEPAAAERLKAAKEKLGFLPNMYGAMAHVPAVLAGYLDGYAAFREQCGFTPPEQETVFLTISLENGCTYCAAAHSMLADKVSKMPADSLAALREGRALPDPKLNALATFTRTMVTSRGNPSRTDVQAFLDAGFTQQQALGVLLAIAVKTFSNYTNHMFATPIDDVFAGHKLAA